MKIREGFSNKNAWKPLKIYIKREWQKQKNTLRVCPKEVKMCNGWLVHYTNDAEWCRILGSAMF